MRVFIVTDVNGVNNGLKLADTNQRTTFYIDTHTRTHVATRESVGLVIGENTKLYVNQ